MFPSWLLNRVDSVGLEYLAKALDQAANGIKFHIERARREETMWANRARVLKSNRDLQREHARERQREALQLARRGLKNREIGEKLGCSTRTVTRLLGTLPLRGDKF